jgi:hypothetical protein
MITHRESLSQALDDVEAGALADVSTLVVNRCWWDALSPNERSRYQSHAQRLGVALRADVAMSSHLVEARSGDAGPPLSTEQPM